MKQPAQFLGRCPWFAVCPVLSATVLFLIGNWCLESTNLPPPPLAIQLPQRLLTGLGFMFWNPVTLIPLTLILITSRFLMSKLSKLSSAAVTVVGLIVVLVGAFWVPNPIMLWPISILGEHTLPELIGELFTFHIVPSPGGSHNATASFQSLFRWQIEECGARFCILVIGWTACLVTIWIIDGRLRTSERSLHPTAAVPGS
jgi:hypothetical protein